MKSASPHWVWVALALALLMIGYVVTPLAVIQQATAYGVGAEGKEITV